MQVGEKLRAEVQTLRTRLKEHVGSGCQVIIISCNSFSISFSITSSIIFSSSSPKTGKCEETGNLCNGMTLNFVFLLHLLLHLLLLLLCRLTAALWVRATKLVPTRHASKKQERGNADLEKWKDRDINRQNGGERGGGHLCNISEVLVMSCVLFIVESVRRSQI